MQVSTGYYAGHYKRRLAVLITNEVPFRSHRAFGSFFTVLYILGLFAGVAGFIGALTVNDPPLELDSASFNIHTWGSFPVFFIVARKTYTSSFNKKVLYAKRKSLGTAMFLALPFTLLTAAVSYYVRTLPSNPQHPPPVFLLPYEWLGVQLVLPFVFGGIIGALILRRVSHMKQTKTRIYVECPTSQPPYASFSTRFLNMGESNLEGSLSSDVAIRPTAPLFRKVRP